MTVTVFVLDTDIVTHVQAGRQPAMRYLAATPSNYVFTTVITLREQLRGRLAAIDRAAEGPELEFAYDRLLATVNYFARVQVLPFTAAALKQLQQLRQQQIRIGTQDLRIAAIVLSVNGVLVTGNRRDYEKIPGLQIEDWTR
ncbi:MAG: type II toxin-antitoxin system VapC family toxin [Caldilinea sp.]|nr:type II toxin-antitoxin system VapC family toxin [Caldilinea sp.]